ncbi:hypothetical protein MKW92_017880, partial [Papaver armeniacum]
SVIVADIIGPLMHLLQNAEFDIKKEAAWAISNATSGDPMSRSSTYSFCFSWVQIVTVCLEGLENILKVGEAEKTIGNTDGVNLYAHMIDEAEGLEKIENLQSHDNTEIYEKAEEDEMPPPGDALPKQKFHYGGTQPQIPSMDLTYR